MNGQENSNCNLKQLKYFFSDLFNLNESVSVVNCYLYLIFLSTMGKKTNVNPKQVESEEEEVEEVEE